MSLSVGLVCPYSFEAPGGVQFHVRDLAEYLLALGHRVSVLAPSATDDDLPEYGVSGGAAVAVPYNGSVARVNFGPVANARVRKWLSENEFDILHIHEPVTPSLSLLALWQAPCPVVATFHTANLRSRAMHAAYPLVRSSLEKVSARIAVSEDARRTLVEHFGGDAVVIPNGVYVADFACAEPDPRWIGDPQRPTVAFLGRIDEPRKGLEVLTRALPQIRARHRGVRLLVAGRGDRSVVGDLGDDAASVEFLGGISDQEKSALLRSVDLYVAPQTGGESFGIVLVEAMSAGAVVVASDLGAFRRVLDEGRYGHTFAVGDPQALAGQIVDLLDHPDERAQIAAAASLGAARFDWSVVGRDVLSVYEMLAGAPAPSEPRLRNLLGRWRR